jgi:putative ABC transport system ATP-binding protein
MSLSVLGDERGGQGADVPVVEGRSLVKSFGRTPALTGASVAVASGEILAVMGPSGSGKSTLLHCLAGIFTPDTGEVHFAGRRIDRLGETRRSQMRRKDFGFVFQFGQLVPELTVEDNIALPLLLGGTARRDAYAAARSWLPRLGLDGLGPRRTGEVSGGEAQRVALARALVHHPSVLFADEPTGSLDSLTGEQVMELLVTLTRAEGTTVVLVTHEARVAAYADRMVLVRDGQVTLATPPAAPSHPADAPVPRTYPPSLPPSLAR